MNIKQIKVKLMVLVLLSFTLSINAQETDEVILKKIADGIIEQTSFSLKSKTSNDILQDFSKAKNELYLVNPYNEWRYWNGVLGLAMINFSDYLKNDKYAEYAKKNIQFSFDNRIQFKKMQDAGHLKGMDQFYKHELLDDCGAMGADLAEVYNMQKRTDYRQYLDVTADYILNKENRLSDGTLARKVPHDKTVWLDDLYMSVPFLARYALIAKDDKYFDFAAKQVMLFTKNLYNKETGLYSHCYYDGVDKNGPAYWGRANGWSIIAQAELLLKLPKNHPDRDSLLNIFRQQIIGFSKYQSNTGLWHQLLNKENSFLETSSSAMFTYAVAAGINNGWLDEIYADLALSGWNGVKTMITQDGKVKNISKGTGTSTSLKYYYDRPTPLNDIHGLGPVIMAGVEIMRLKEKLAHK
jgi:unsaturated rhamnogalacturonyl hydrolase